MGSGVDFPGGAGFTLALVAGVCVLSLLILLGLAIRGSGNGRRTKRRIDTIRRRATPDRLAGGAQPTLRLAGPEVRAGMLERVMVRWLPRPEVLRARLARTGRPISLSKYGAWVLGLSVGVTLLLMVLLQLSLLPSLLCGTLFGVLLPHLAVGRMAKRRLAAFIALFPEAIDLMVRALRSGLPITEAMITVGQEMADPVGTEFRKVEGGMKLGRSLEDVLWEMTKRLDLAEFRFFVVSISVQRETGGNLGETLANLSDILRRRRQMALKVKAMSSEARASAMILGSLPFVVGILITVSTPSYLAPMISDVRGLVMIGIGLLMLLTGVAIMAKMIKFEI